MTTSWLHTVAETPYWRNRVNLAMKAVANDVMKEDDNAWQATIAYGAHTYLEVDVTGTLYWVEVTTAGTSGSTEPTWTNVKGATYSDGGVTWTNRGARTAARKTLATNVLNEASGVNFAAFAKNIMDNATIASEVNGTGASESAETVSDANIEFACNEQWHAWSGE